MKTFTLDDQQEANYKHWVKNHNCPYYQEDLGYRYVGACGGADTFTFVPTSLGSVVTVCCVCGAELDLSEEL